MPLTIFNETTSRRTPLKIKKPPLNTDELIEALDISLAELLNRNGTGSEKERCDSSFYYKKGKPGISLMDYLQRIRKYTDLSMEVLLLASVYVENIMENGELNLEKLNIHK
jgi:hypothetical protein